MVELLTMDKDVGFTELDFKHKARLRELVDQAKREDISRDMIGAACGMSGSGVSQYYRGNRRIGFDAALKFSIFFNIPTEQLYTTAANIIVSPELQTLIQLLQNIPESDLPRARQLLLGVAGKAKS